MPKRLRAPRATGLPGAGALVLLVVLAVAGSALAALGAPKPPVTATPTISGGPSGPTSSTAATFTFTGASGATMRCALDGGSYATCPTSTSSPAYTGLGQGPHTFRVTAQQTGKGVSDPATRTWTVDTVAPAAPTITKAPESDDPQTAQFKLGGIEPGATSQCSLDGGAFSGCGTTANYNGLQAGDHCFRARVVDAAGNVSPVQELCWTIVVKQAFGIAGEVAGLLAPGVERPLDLRLSNPNNFDLNVLDLTITITASSNACRVADLRVVQGGTVRPGGTVTFSSLVLPKKATRTLTQLAVPTDELVAIRYVNTADNQDGCRNNTLTLTYAGTATK